LQEVHGAEFGALYEKLEKEGKQRKTVSACFELFTRSVEEFSFCLGLPLTVHESLPATFILGMF
jgi:hypothetical protein